MGLVGICLLLPLSTQAELSIEITEGVEGAMPIAIVPFLSQGASGRAPVDIAGIVTADLSRSGYFKTLPVGDMLAKPHQAKNVRFRNWQALAQDFLVVGEVSQNMGKYAVKFQLLDVYKGKQLTGYSMTVSEKELRRTAHRISDIIFHKLTGIKGVFSTRIAYITSTREADKKKRYKLQVADADGHNPLTIATSVEPLMSPAWSPDGKRIAYVSFEKKSPAIYVQVLATGKRTKVAGFPGINGAPSWSPDGKRLALTLSKDGSPDIFVLRLSNQSLQRLTKSYAIDTEPSWSPDGKQIVFTSDRGGKAQLYSMPSRGGRAKRMTFDGDYNANGIFSPDGKNLAMVHANQGDYRIAIKNLQTGSLNILTSGRLDESPSFAPNGSMIIYASNNGQQETLAIISADGRMHQTLEFEQGDVREPAWSP